MSKTNCGRCYLLIFAGLLATAPVHADKMPEMWGPKVVSPTSLHVPEPKTSVTEEHLKYVPLHPVLFNSGKATISAEGQKALDAAAEYLLKHSHIKRILIEGNTDYIGNSKHNDRLSERRTEMVRNYLIVKGVDSNLIVMNGRGETTPVDQNWTREGRQRNRHVTIYAVHWQPQSTPESN